jgi:hypothetical protein
MSKRLTLVLDNHTGSLLKLYLRESVHHSALISLFPSYKLACG